MLRNMEGSTTSRKTIPRMDKLKAQTTGYESSFRTKQQEIMLWHFRLGHPHFQCLKHLFPSLFNNKDVFQCDICQFAKHQCPNYPSQPYKAYKPFAMIHSDIWDPSHLQSLIGKKLFIIYL